MKIHISDRYLWFPVKKDGNEVKLEFFCDGIKIRELDIRLAHGKKDLYTVMDIKEYAGREVEIKCDPEDEDLSGIVCRAEKNDKAYPYRPEIHFTAPAGWINDPNGLIYSDGIYHLYHQWNPYGTEWGNMHWGHGISRDLIHWENRPGVMEPDCYGTVYSGCAIKDSENITGHGRNALLFFYTAAGGMNKWSKECGNTFTQRLAVSTDDGETLEKKELILDNIRGENRDPKIFYHHKSKAFVMVLFLDDNEFAIFRSEDLIHWDETQRFSAGKMWECPDLFEAAIENDPGKKRWVFWSADGYYMVGDFDGFKFTPGTDVLSAYDTGLPYAAQTYSGIEDRIISVAWYRTKSDEGGFRGMMSLPAELSLLNTKDSCRICFKPVSQLWDNFHLSKQLFPEGRPVEEKPGGRPVAAVIRWNSADSGRVKAGDINIEIDHKGKPATVIIDHGIVEYFADDGLVYGAVETEEDVLFKGICTGPGVESIMLYTPDFAIS